MTQINALGCSSEPQNQQAAEAAFTRNTMTPDLYRTPYRVPLTTYQRTSKKLTPSIFSQTGQSADSWRNQTRHQQRWRFPEFTGYAEQGIEVTVCFLVICLCRFHTTRSRVHGTIRARADLHSYIHTYIHTCMHTYIHTYIHTYVHTYVHTYAYANIHTSMGVQHDLGYRKLLWWDRIIRSI